MTQSKAVIGGAVRTLAIAVVAIFAVAGCEGSGSAASSESAAASESAETSPAFRSADLPRIVLTEDGLGPGMTLDDLRTGLDALLQPLAREETESTLQSGFADARMTRIGTTGQDSYWEVGGYVTWAAVYQSDADAAAAFDVLVAEHKSERGLGMQEVGRSAQGDEGVTLEGEAYGWDANLLYIWRHRNLIMAAGALGVTATEDDVDEQLGSIAEDMDTRASD